jgi:hypothetical protein
MYITYVYITYVYMTRHRRDRWRQSARGPAGRAGGQAKEPGPGAAGLRLVPGPEEVSE